MNTLIITGRLGKDAEVKTLDSGKKVMNYSVAVTDKYGDKENTIWFDCAQWSEKTAVAEYLKKGTQVCVQGKVDIRKWDGGATLTIRVDKVELMGGKKESSANTTVQPLETGHTEPIDDLPF